ncbi:MAG TPA: cytochrome c peroxidase [Anaeromyxobacter sp.]|nr:cytochrome c peroxidase [Anaeromyxobacter sp.]
MTRPRFVITRQGDGGGSLRRFARPSAIALLVALAFGAGRGDAANTITNGSAQGLPPAFLFEPEVPLASLKQVPIWNELEQLLDNPYAMALCSAMAGQPVLVQNTPGNEQGFPAYCATITRRAGFGVTLPPLLVHPLNYNTGSGEEMRLLNVNYPGGAFDVPAELVQCTVPNDPPGCPEIPDPNRWVWRFATVEISPGSARIEEGEAALDHNAPIAADVVPTDPSTFVCVTSLEAFPPEGSIMCGGDPGEPNYGGFGVLRDDGYSTPAVPGVASAITPISLSGPGAQRLYDPERGFIPPRDPVTGAGGLRKPSLRVPPVGAPGAPGYGVNSAAALAAHPSDLQPSNENDYVRDRTVAAALGKALFWDMQVGSDGIQSCATCHFSGTGTDTRTKNQLNPNHINGNDIFLDVGDTAHPAGGKAANYDLKASDFPLHDVRNPDVAADPACTTPIVATVSAALENFPPGVSAGDPFTVCDAGNLVRDVNDVVSSMGVVFSPFTDIAPIGAFLPAFNGVAAVAPDLRTAGAVDPIPAFQGLRRVEPRNTPTMQAAAFNFDNFWDGRARHDFNGGSVFGAADPQAHVWVCNSVNPGATACTSAATSFVATRQLVRLASIASLATGPGLSEFEMSFAGRSWPKIGKKLLQPVQDPTPTPANVRGAVTPLANQLVSPTDSVLGPWSNQGGSACATLPSVDRSPGWSAAGVDGRPGLCISYPALIRRAFYPALWVTQGRHLNGCYTDGRSPACSGTPAIPILADGAVNDANTDDPFDHYVLTPAANAPVRGDTNQFTQMEANFSLFWGLAVHLWVNILVPDDTPFDQLLDANPDAFLALGEPGEPGLVDGQLHCTTPDQRNCFREVGRFKRDPDVRATILGPTGPQQFAAGGTRAPGDPDPLLGMDIFFASNLSLKNPNFRTARCGECHAIPTLTDHTIGFTFKAVMRDFVGEFGTPGAENPIEPLGRLRTISGFLLESEIGENGQDGVERRIINQSIVPNAVDGLAYPDGLQTPLGPDGIAGTADDYVGAGQAFFDNGVYNLGVRPIVEDLGRGGTDAFGWPLSLAALMLKNLGGPGFEPGAPLPNFACASDPCDPTLDATGGLFEETAQDQAINPGFEDEPAIPMLPEHLARWANHVNSGEAPPDFDEVFAGLNTMTDVAIIEGFLDTLGPFNPAALVNEGLNVGEAPLMGTWPYVNRVGRMGSFKAPQIRNVELTGPYFHNGGKLTLRQVVDFYTRGGDFPVTNAAHRDFNLVNMDIEVQSNLTEEEKVALVDFLLELTDERNRFDRAPFDHPEVILPIDGLAPDNAGRAALITNPMFHSLPAVGAAGRAPDDPEPTFMNVTKVRVSGADAERGKPACDYEHGIVSHYCH